MVQTLILVSTVNWRAKTDLEEKKKIIKKRNIYILEDNEITLKIKERPNIL